MTNPVNPLKANPELKLVCVVTTHNRLAELRVTIARLLMVPEANLAAVVVVNNCSTDGTKEWLDTQRGPRILVHHSEENLGGAGGFEVGMRLAVQKFDPDWVVVMDDDARPIPGALEYFSTTRMREDESNQANIWAAAVYFPNGEICEMNRPSVNPFWRPKVFFRTLFGGRRDGYHIPRTAYGTDKLCELDMASFVGMFIPRVAIESVGYPEGALFLYGDDVIYSLRLRRQGFKMMFDPTLKFEHNCSTFADDQKRVFSPIWKVYYTYRNGLIMYRNAAGMWFWPLLLLLMPKWFLASRRYGADRKTYLRLTRRAIVDGVLGRKTLKHSAVLDLAKTPL